VKTQQFVAHYGIGGLIAGEAKIGVQDFAEYFLFPESAFF
jgi:hypothetical protein